MESNSYRERQCFLLPYWLQRGFLSLDEIDESECNLDIAKSSGGSEKKGKTKPKKQKVDTKNEELNGEAKSESKEEIEEVENESKQKKKKKKKKDAVNEAEGNSTSSMFIGAQ